MDDGVLLSPAAMASDDELFTEQEVLARYRGAITLATLQNWRTNRMGPTYLKVGRTVLYSRSALAVWEKRNTIACTKT